MKVVLLPGVGFHNHKQDNLPLLNNLKKAFPTDEFEFFNWKHCDIVPDMTNINDGFILKPIRNFAVEVILDFQEVMTNAIAIEIPEADVYIGHSAGGIIALVQTKPAILMGSPAALVKNIDYYNINSYYKASDKQRPVLSIINKKDVLAYPLKCAENFYYSAGWNPISSHTDYWDNKKVFNKIKDTLINWKNI